MLQATMRSARPSPLLTFDQPLEGAVYKLRIQWTLIAALIFALIIAIFAVANVGSVPLSYLFGEAQIPLILVILGSTLLGGLIVGLFGIVRQYRMQRHIRELEALLKKHNIELPEKRPHEEEKNPAKDSVEEPSEESAKETDTPTANHADSDTN